MQLLLFCYIFIIGISLNGSEFRGDDDDYCLYQGKGGIFVKRGKKVDVPNDCMQLECDENQRLFARTCPEIEVPNDPQCKVSRADLTRIFPSCCPVLECA